MLVFAIAMQVCIFAHELIILSRQKYPEIVGPAYRIHTQSVHVCAASASADAQFACAALLHFNNAIQPTVPHYNSLHATLALYNSTTGSILCGLTPEKQNY